MSVTLGIGQCFQCPFRPTVFNGEHLVWGSCMGDEETKMSYRCVVCISIECPHVSLGGKALEDMTLAISFKDRCFEHSPEFSNTLQHSRDGCCVCTRTQ